jgi:hypothetical protein
MVGVAICKTTARGTAKTSGGWRDGRGMGPAISRMTWMIWILVVAGYAYYTRALGRIASGAPRGRA